MKIEKFTLNENNNNATLTAYIQDNPPELPQVNPRPAVVICPGGGYEYCSDREADPVAFAFMGQGFHAFVVRYSVGKAAAFPESLIDLSRAMKIIRENGDKWGVDSEKIAVCGFSAGGHLVASLATLWNHPEISERAGCLNGENRPNAVILGYPVITTRSWMNASGCMARLVGDRDYDQTIELLSCEKNVGSHTPPCFIYHTYTDPVVSVDDSLAFGMALSKHSVPFDMRIYSYGEHGLSLSRNFTGGYDFQVSEWLDDCTDWLWRLFGNPEYQPFKTVGSRPRFSY